MSEYDLISNLRTEDSPLVPWRMKFFRNFFTSQPIKLKFGPRIQNWILILIFVSKIGFGDDFGQYDTKTIILRQTPLRNSIVMTTPKVLGDQKLFERVCYMLKLKMTNFQLPTPNGIVQIFPLPVQNRVSFQRGLELTKIRQGDAVPEVF